MVHWHNLTIKTNDAETYFIVIDWLIYFKSLFLVYYLNSIFYFSFIHVHSFLHNVKRNECAGQESTSNCPFSNICQFSAK